MQKLFNLKMQWYLPNRLRSKDELLACVRYGRGGGGGGGSFLGPICAATTDTGRLVGPDWPLCKKNTQIIITHYLNCFVQQLSLISYFQYINVYFLFLSTLHCRLWGVKAKFYDSMYSSGKTCCLLWDLWTLLLTGLSDSYFNLSCIFLSSRYELPWLMHLTFISNAQSYGNSNLPFFLTVCHKMGRPLFLTYLQLLWTEQNSKWVRALSDPKHVGFFDRPFAPCNCCCNQVSIRRVYHRADKGVWLM